MFVDTHCHIHTADSKIENHTVKKWHDAGEMNGEALLVSAKAGGVSKMICVGTDYADSELAVNFVQAHEGCWAAVGVHPHEAKGFLKNKDFGSIEDLLKKKKVVAIGEVGLDYYYEHSPRKEQKQLVEVFLDLAEKHDLPVIFHVREAFKDFWPILANFNKIRGVMHSFTAGQEDANKALSRGFYVGLNGIMTFTKDQQQLEVAKNVPLDRLLLETDAPYLAPKSKRGKICKPEYIDETYDFLIELRNENKDEFIRRVELNVNELFGI